MSRRAIEKVVVPLDTKVDGFPATLWCGFLVRRRGRGASGYTAHECDFLMDEINEIEPRWHPRWNAPTAPDSMTTDVIGEYFKYCWNEGYSERDRLDGKAAHAFASDYWVQQPQHALYLHLGENGVEMVDSVTGVGVSLRIDPDLVVKEEKA